MGLAQFALDPPKAQQNHAGQDGAGNQRDTDEKEYGDQNDQSEHKKYDALDQAGLRAGVGAKVGVLRLIHERAVSLSKVRPR